MKFKSQVFTQASGSIGGQTFSHNRGGMYTRARAIPTNPNSPRQALARAALTASVMQWNSLTDAQRAGWDNYAQNTPVTNVLGDQIILSGQQQFVRSNSYRIRAGLAVVSAAPVIFNTGEAWTSISSAVFVDPDLTVSGVMSTAASDDGDVAGQLGFSLNAGRTYYGGPYQFGATNALAAASNAPSVVISTSDVDVPIVIGNRIPIRVRNLYDDGRVSAEFRDVVTIT